MKNKWATLIVGKKGRREQRWPLSGLPIGYPAG